MEHTPSYCTVSECEEPTRQGRVRCDFHEKRHQRGQSLTAPKAERLSPNERLLEAVYRFAETDAEDDAAFARNRLGLFKAARQAVRSVTGELVRQGMAEARRRGVRLGAPPRMTYSEAMRHVSQHGSVKAAVRAGVASRNTLRRALRRGPETSIANPSKRAA